MPRLDSTRYTVLFAAAVCVGCALLVAASAVGLRSRQEANQQLYMEKNVLLAAGLASHDERLSAAEVRAVFDRAIEARLVDLATGELVPADRLDARGYDQRRARNDPVQSRPAPPNDAGIPRLPRYGRVYFVRGPHGIDQVVLAIEGLGMWGTVYGFLSIDRDGRTIRGLTYYDQKETPGLGGEISNPKWQALWEGRKAYDEKWAPRITVVKGDAGPPDRDPFRVDGLSGATVTSNAITRLTRFWLSDDGYGRYLRKFREGAGT